MFLNKQFYITTLEPTTNALDHFLTLLTGNTTVLFSKTGQFQIIFNPISASELAKMPRELQLNILGEFRGLPHEVMKSDLQHFGKLERHGKILHRFRLGDYRVYFERHELGIVVHRILSRNSLKDFLFRSSLPTGEDEALQQNPKFWELIEAASASSR